MRPVYGILISVRLSHFFLPHPKTHEKARLISWEAILIYILLAIFLQVGFNLFATFKPGVLGVISNATRNEIINLTNQQRTRFNLSTLKENQMLNLAAEKKARNMFEENYWAHYSPSGKDPWGFIRSSGYKYYYAGENLARNFYTSKDAVDAWIASPTHKENIMSSKFKEIGVAVLEGTLNGEKTTLIVQMFGARDTSSLADENMSLKIQANVAGSKSMGTLGIPAVDRYAILKTLGLSVIITIFSLLLIDLVIMKKRGVERLASRHLPHLALLGLGASALINLKPGSIL